MSWASSAFTRTSAWRVSSASVTATRRTTANGVFRRGSATVNFDGVLQLSERPCGHDVGGTLPRVVFIGAVGADPAERFNTAASDSTTRKAQMHFCSDAQMPRSVKIAGAVLTDRVFT